MGRVKAINRLWWKEAVVYQIYPKSFKDSNGDGVGDLGGIIEKLDYLEQLGVDVVWLCPIYASPHVDNGYDISDYYRIHLEFGTFEQFDRLLEGLHRRGMKLIMDLVVNHTSDQHRWFREACSSKQNRYRNYYIWHKPRRPLPANTPLSEENGQGGGPDISTSRQFLPNNWLSFFEGPAWQYDSSSGEYYLHLFSLQQPDLNWENQELREEIYTMMRWWLDRGIDGFRMDVINLISKHPDFPDSTDGGASRIIGGEYFINGPKVMQHLQEMRSKVLDKYDVMTVGETPDVSPEEGLRYVGGEKPLLNMLFQFEHMDIDNGSEGYWSVGEWSLVELKRILGNWQQQMARGGWNSLYLNNHDQPRMVSRFGDDGKYRRESAKMLATMIHMMQGTPYIYQGEELGMTNADFEDITEYRDVATLNYYRRATEEEGLSPESAMRVVRYRSRDNGRTPMQWSDSPHAGFSTGEAWIEVNRNHTLINANTAVKDPDSVFNYYRRLIQFRREHPAVVYGSYTDLLPEHEKLFVFQRTGADECLLVLLNFSADTVPVDLLAVGTALESSKAACQKSIANYSDSPEILEAGSIELTLRPYEAVVYSQK
ncbi:MAG: alpha-glucosidase [Spirochaetia bacterium]